MTRGRKPIPGPLRIAKGTNKANPGRENKQAPEPDGTLGKPPAYLKLSAEAKKVWEDDAPYFATNLDRRAFGRYCEATADANKFHAQCVKEGWTVKGSRFTNPKARLYQDARDFADRLASSFGLKPAERTKIKVPEKRKPGPADRFFNRGRDGY